MEDFCILPHYKAHVCQAVFYKILILYFSSHDYDIIRTIKEPCKNQASEICPYFFMPQIRKNLSTGLIFKIYTKRRYNGDDIQRNIIEQRTDVEERRICREQRRI